jgi:hypothetical protein
MLRQASWIDEANTKIDITDVLASVGVFVPESIRNGGNKKVYCPFGFYHSDGGATKAMRVYKNNNTVYCFSCSKRYSPVSLAAAKWDCSWMNAAFRLLEDAGFKPKSLEERWAEATTPVENKPDLIALADALKTYCSGVADDWGSLQLEDNVAETLNKCLGLLNIVSTEEDATKWLYTCKKVMRRLLEAS